MSTNPWESTERGTQSTDDTAAFQRFYLGGAPKASRSWLYRLFVGWWRDRS